MKTLSSTGHRTSLAAGIGVLTVAAFILLFATPLLSFAATSPITLSVGGPYNSGQSISISGTVTPATATTAIAIKITNPSGVLVGAATVSVDQTTGAFSYTQNAGGTVNWVNGTYTVTATYSGASQTATFQYGSVTTTTTTSTGSGVTTTVFYNVTTTIESHVTTTVVQQVQTTVTAQPITSVTTIQNNSTTTVQQTSSLDTALAAVAIIIAIVAIVLVFMRKK